MRWQFSFIENVLHYVTLSYRAHIECIKKIFSFLITFLCADIRYTHTNAELSRNLSRTYSLPLRVCYRKSIKFDKRGHICKSCACNLKRSAKKLICYSECTPFLKSAYQCVCVYVKHFFYYVCLFNFPGINIRRCARICNNRRKWWGDAFPHNVCEI